MKIILALISCVIAVSCAPKTMNSIPIAVPPTMVTVTDTKPLVQAVEKQTDRLETRINDTSQKVDAISDSVNQSVEDAIKSGDQAREAQAKAFQKQVAELKSMTDIATATAKDLKEDSKAAHTELAKASEERDAAYKVRETIRRQMLDNKEEFKVQASRLDEKRILADDDASWWKKRALYTWGALAALLALATVWKFYFH